jgi:hypothetical protein
MHGNTTCLIGFKQPNSDLFWLPIIEEKIDNHCTKILWVLFDIQTHEKQQNNKENKHNVLEGF